MRPYNDQQTAHIDYTGEKFVSLASDLPANLTNYFAIRCCFPPPVRVR